MSCLGDDEAAETSTLAGLPLDQQKFSRESDRSQPERWSPAFRNL